MNTILVVEDNADNMNLIVEILEDEGFNVVRAGLAQDGIALLKEISIDLVLMDISLPKMNGHEATRIIKADPAIQDVTVIALTANAMFSDRELALAAGCDDFLTKPVDEDHLLKTIGRYLK